ncbi:MAG: methyltransferase [Thermoproteota archaeon]
MSHYFMKQGKKVTTRLLSEYVLGVTVEFYVARGLFSVDRIDEGTRLLLESARLPESGVVLDLGCGYGAIGITVAKAKPALRVVMVDVNPLAVKLAKLNAKHNGVQDRVEVYLGDLYEPVKGQVFDAILTNPPISAGMEVVSRIVREAKNHLKPGGSLQMVVRKGAGSVSSMLEEHFGGYEVLARKRGYTVLYAEKTQ